MINWPDSGFTEDTIESLKNECRKKFNENPTIFFVLLRMLAIIEGLFEGQAMEKDLHDAFTGLMPMFKKVTKQRDLQSLDELVRRFNEIYSL